MNAPSFQRRVHWGIYFGQPARQFLLYRGILRVGCYVGPFQFIVVVIVQFDTIPPSAPAQPHVLETGSTHVVLRWDASVEKDVDHYSVYASPEPNAQPSLADLVGSPKGARFVDWGIEPGPTFYCPITAVDRQGNEWEPCAAVKVVTERD